MKVRIRDRCLDIPLIQGGMGIGISLGGLAGAVAAEGGMGTVSAAGVGFREPDFDSDMAAANARALKKEIAAAKERARGHGLVAVNIMTAMNFFEESARAAVEGGADAIVSGAGLPKSLPAFTKGTGVLAAPVVSSGRAASAICRLWDRHYETAPDFVVVEGSGAGGHLGFSAAELASGSCPPLEQLVADVKQALAVFEEKYKRHIPVFAAGGIRTAEDVKRHMAARADGVQLATVFAAAEECDASAAYKRILINASDSDIRIVKSPVGMPGRALETPLIKRVEALGRVAPAMCRACIRTCDPSKTLYCISNALIAAWRGDLENGLFFCGGSVDSVRSIRPVKEIIAELGLAHLTKC